MGTQRLTRDLENGMLGGVCAGIANRLDTDPTLVRVAAVLLALVTGGLVAVVYLALWIIMPRPDAPAGRPSRDRMAEELRDAGDRLQEAAGILSRNAKQAASELSEASRRRAATAGGAASTSTGASAGGDGSGYDAPDAPEPPAAPEGGAGESRPQP